MAERQPSSLSQRLVTLAILGTVVLVIVGAIVLLRFGRHQPSPPSLEESPRLEIPGTIVFINDEGCVIIAAASGATRERLACGHDWARFAEPDVIEYGRYASGLPSTAVRRVVSTGVETRITNSDGYGPPPFRPSSVDGAIADVEADGSIFVATADGVRRLVYDCDCPEGHQPQPLFWSPDGGWLLMVYYGNHDGTELWIIGRDGAVAGTLAKSTRGQASWWIPTAGIAP